jgi:hypothetical protein
LNINKSNEADISLSASLRLLTSMVFTFASLNFTSLESIMAETFDIKNVMKDEKYEKLRNVIKCDQESDLDECMEVFNEKLTPANRVPQTATSKNDVIKKLNELRTSPVKKSALKLYNLLKGPILPDNFRKDIETNALQSTLKTISGKLPNVDQLKSYRAELLVCGLLKPATAYDVKVIIQRNIENGQPTQ